jgi:hypothetical protein
MIQDNGSGVLVLSGIPRLSGGAGAAIQASQNSGVQETDPTTSTSAPPVGTIAGQVDLSRQLFDLSQPGLHVGIADDLGRATGVLLDAQLVSGSGSSGQLRGLANVSGILAFAMSATTVQGQLSAIWDGFNRLAGPRASGIQSQGLRESRPRGLLPLYASAAVRLALRRLGRSGRPNHAQPSGRARSLGRYPHEPGRRTNEDEVLIAEKSSLVLVGGEPSVRVYEGTGSGTLTVRVSSWGYAALVVKNPPPSFGLADLRTQRSERNRGPGNYGGDALPPSELSPCEGRARAGSFFLSPALRSSVYARPRMSWPANRLRQVPDASMLRRERAVLTNFDASSDSRASRSRSA